MTDPLPTGDVVLAASYSYDLLHVAADLARTHGRRLRIVHVIRDVEWLLDPRPSDELLALGLRGGETLLTDLTAVAGDSVDVRPRLLLGSLYDALLGEAASAGIVVVGDGLLASWLRAHAACPVVTPARLSPVPPTDGGSECPSTRICHRSVADPGTAPRAPIG